MMKLSKDVKVRVVIPHYFCESKNAAYGSSREGQRLSRCIALSRCISSLLGLTRTSNDSVLNIGTRSIDTWKNSAKDTSLRVNELSFDINVFVTGDSFLNEVLDNYSNAITVHTQDLEDPRHLALAARRWLIHSEPIADISIYLEDDLVITDSHFFDKIVWFTENAQQDFLLMPHRFEVERSTNSRRLIVDGPLDLGFIRKFCNPVKGALKANFGSWRDISFDIAANPHSGLFYLDRSKVNLLRSVELHDSGFVGPLETAATLTVLNQFKICKASEGSHRFFEVEHAHPSFLGYLK